MATAGGRLGAVRPSLRPAASKVPSVTALFWVIKILTTAMGEATSDYLVHTISPVVAVGLGFAGLLAALALQFQARRYVPWIYWLAVTMVAVFGTMVADALHVGLGIPYQVSTAAFALTLGAVFAAWYASEGSLSIHSIRTRRRETFYWAAVMATFALGTAAGDLTAYSLRLGYLASGLMFCIAITAPPFWYWLLRRGPILAFWSAYILTRPLGASFADWLGVPRALGGLDWGRGTVSLGLTLVIAVLVGYLTLTGRTSGRGTGRAAERDIATWDGTGRSARAGAAHRAVPADRTADWKVPAGDTGETPMPDLEWQAGRLTAQLAGWDGPEVWGDGADRAAAHPVRRAGQAERVAAYRPRQMGNAGWALDGHSARASQANWPASNGTSDWEALSGDSLSRDSLSGESLSRDSVSRESLSRDSVSRESLSRDSVSRESLSRESGAGRYWQDESPGRDGYPAIGDAQPGGWADWPAWAGRPERAAPEGAGRDGHGDRSGLASPAGWRQADDWPGQLPPSGSRRGRGGRHRAGG